MDAQVAKVRPITIAIVALGGEGGGVLADWIVDLAEHGGYLAQATSVPGVAQRTGATIYYVELFPKSGGAGRRARARCWPDADAGRRRHRARLRTDGSRARGRTRLRHAGQDAAHRLHPPRLRHDREDRARRRPGRCGGTAGRLPRRRARARGVRHGGAGGRDRQRAQRRAVRRACRCGRAADAAHGVRGGDPPRPGRRQQQPRRVRRRLRGGAAPAKQRLPRRMPADSER